jgi:hypothetical protein
MKNTLFILCLLVCSLLACKKSKTDSTDNTLPKEAETKSQFNNTSFGVYKGVIVGSSGTIVFRINNGDNIVKGYLSIDNVKDTLSTTQQLTAGQPIVNVNFVGRLSSMTLSANADGSNAEITNISIVGHNYVKAFLAHENSNLQIMCYEGKFTGDLTGIMNVVKIGSDNNSAPLHLLEKIDLDTFIYKGNGIPDIDTSGNTHYFHDTGNPYRTFGGKGKLAGNTFSGSWSSWTPNGTYQGLFMCNRTY